MQTGFRATFVFSWSQTELDGVPDAPLELVATGAPWRWQGVARRLDGAPDLLRLEEAEGMADLRRRAGRMVRRLTGIALAGPSEPAAEIDPVLPPQSFVLTDGRATWTAQIIDPPPPAGRLLSFTGALPPAGRDLWIVRHSLERTAPGIDRQGGVICFTPGTRLATAEGPRLIESLRPGDHILTRDNGPQQVIWTGRRRMSGARLFAMPHLRPIRLRAGVFGQGQPDADLIVSPQHRMLVRGAAARALFNTDEVLVAAEALVNDDSIAVDHSLREVTYVHVMLERHNVVWANGLETESFHPGAAVLDAIDLDQRAALEQALPGVVRDPGLYGTFARRNLSSPEAAILRHEIGA